MTFSTSPVETGDVEYDATFLNARREGILIFLVWFLCMIWAVPVCYFTGFNSNIDPEKIEMIWGVPEWAFWGIVVPWLAADVFTVWLCFFYMQDDDLGEDQEGLDLVEEIAEINAADATNGGAA